MTITTREETGIAVALLNGGTGWIASMDHEVGTPSLTGCFQWVDGPERGQTVYSTGPSTSCASPNATLSSLYMTIGQSSWSTQPVLACSVLTGGNALMPLDCVTGRAAGFLVEYERNNGEWLR